MAINKEQNKLNVPPLRFPEFHGEWEEHGLSEYLDFKNGLNPDSKRFGKGIKFISVMDILNNPVITYDCIRASVQATDAEMSSFSVEYGDILFQRSSETLEDVGRANVYIDDKVAVFGGFVIRGKKKANYNPLFFRYLLSSPYARKRIIPMGAGAQHFNIGQEGLSKVLLNFPSIEEQTKIASLLHLLDERIATQSKLIEDLKKLKSAIIDYAINSLDTDFAKFSSLYEMAGEGGTPTTSNASFYDNGKIPFVKIDDLKKKYLTENKDFITELGLQKSSVWLVPTRSILFSNGATIGEITITTYPVCTKQGILGIVPKPNIDVEFLYYFMSSSYFRKAVSRIVTEGTMKTAYLKDINNIRCPIPKKEKQLDIAKMPSALNFKIDFEQSILKLFGSQKQYLLRQMFM
ncbi:restriction endonuclease subunit S [Segatella copri]|uniref:restriction endonuclease subunit S n=1 Tax=Segatella copri TaxID=165179 RepID=UPI001C43E19A|nr:restriction endonuclease subunit S [Segatella copri]MBW0026242.1 restriction endonuclease subunit S [Segatella copri]